MYILYTKIYLLSRFLSLRIALFIIFWLAGRFREREAIRASRIIRLSLLVILYSPFITKYKAREASARKPDLVLLLVSSSAYLLALVLFPYFYNIGWVSGRAGWNRTIGTYTPALYKNAVLTTELLPHIKCLSFQAAIDLLRALYREPDGVIHSQPDLPNWKQDLVRQGDHHSWCSTSILACMDLLSILHAGIVFPVFPGVNQQRAVLKLISLCHHRFLTRRFRTLLAHYLARLFPNVQR